MKNVRPLLSMLSKIAFIRSDEWPLDGILSKWVPGGWHCRNQGGFLRDAIQSAGEAQVRFPFLRGAASFVLVLLGGALSLFSIAVAFGWDSGPLSLAGTIVAVLGLALMLGGFWLIRNMDGAALAAVCLKVAFGFGSTFLVIGLVAVFLPADISIPTGYFLAVGCLCALAFVKFRRVAQT